MASIPTVVLRNLSVSLLYSEFIIQDLWTVFDSVNLDYIYRIQNYEYIKNLLAKHL